MAGTVATGSTRVTWHAAGEVGISRQEQQQRRRRRRRGRREGGEEAAVVEIEIFLIKIKI